MDRLDTMRTFVRVVETGSFSAVARELGIGQPAVSKQIAALEDHVGAQLVQRTSRSVRITQAGREFYDVAARLLAELSDAIANHRAGAVAGLVRVTVAPVFGRLYIIPKLPELLAKHPHLSVEIVVSPHAVNLLEENIDVAIRGGALADSSLVARALGASPLLTVASAAYLARHGEPHALRELDHHARIVFTSGAVRAWRYANGVVHHPTGAVRSNDAEQICAAIVGGLGIAQVPGWMVARELASGAVRAILRDHEPPPVPMSAVRPAGAKVPAKVRVFLDFMAAIFAAEPTLSPP